MATVSPFRAIRFDKAKVGDLTQVVAPPYDVISPEEQQRLHERHPKNIVWIDFGLEKAGDDEKENKYARAARYFGEWLREGTLVKDGAPALYYYTQEFTIPGRGRFVRKGFLGALRLSAFGEGEVFPHEKTLAGPKVDRLALMRATNANMSPIFGLYSDPADEVLKALRKGAAKEPDLVATDDIGVVHRVWTVTDPACLKAAVAAMKDKGVFIADGHHRYETALAFRDEMRKEHGAGDPSKAYEHVLMFLGNMDDEGILILPTHRGIHSLPAFDEEAFVAKVRERLPVETREGSPEDAIRAVEEASAREKAIAFSAGSGRYHLVTFPNAERFADERLSRFPKELRTLDVVLLHGYLLEELLGISPEVVTAGRFVKYYKEGAKAAKELAAGSIQVAFFMTGVTVREFKEVSLSGHVLPQKSTFFYPKIGTGLLINPLGADERLPG